jgi:hypothetical protein
LKKNRSDECLPEIENLKERFSPQKSKDIAKVTPMKSILTVPKASLISLHKRKASFKEQRIMEPWEV